MRKGKGNGKATRRPPAQTLSSESSASPNGSKAIIRLLRNLPAHLRAGGKVRRHQGDALPVPSTGEYDGSQHGQAERDGSSGARSVYHELELKLTHYCITSRCLVLPDVDSFPFRQDRMGNLRRSFHLCSRRKLRTTGAAVDKFRVALGGKPTLEALIAVGELVIAVAISKVRF